MGADTSRLYPPAEESIDAYINRGGARLVNRERKLATCSTVEIGVGGSSKFDVSCQSVRYGPRGVG